MSGLLRGVCACVRPGECASAGQAQGAGGPGAREPGLPWAMLVSVLQAQRWRSENFERPVDLEGSGDDDSFPDDELDDLYSGSGSGCNPRSGLSWLLPSLPAVSAPLEAPCGPALPAAHPACSFISLPSGSFTYPPWFSPVVQTDSHRRPPSPRAWVPRPPGVPAGDSAASPATATTTLVRTTSIRRLPPLPLTTAATAQATSPAAPSPPTTVADLDTEAPTPRLVTVATSRPGALPRPATTQEPDVTERSTLPLGTTAPGPTELAQTPTPESFLTTIWGEPEVPVSGGPSGDFELPEEETTQPDTANEVVAVGGAAAKPSPPPGTLPKGARPGPGLLDNAIDSGSSAAQLPQKSILERKEVLVAVIVGGVVGALFAAFLVTLLIYRMKKKDEGSYTLEEPKQASVTYQKPDKQEEFYA
uniref:Syndecan n=1 Tax=Spermophilus dauricus TaxID=99837 RepID=A0A8C9QLQ4_SPEDA